MLRITSDGEARRTAISVRVHPNKVEALVQRRAEDIPDSIAGARRQAEADFAIVVARIARKEGLDPFDLGPVVRAANVVADLPDDDIRKRRGQVFYPW